MTETEEDSPTVYHADTRRISKTGLDYLTRSPAHYWERYLNPDRAEDEPTPAMVFGSLFHTLVLEPEKYERRYVVAPALHKNSNAYKEWAAAQSELEIINADQLERAQKMATAIRNHVSAGASLKSGKAEQRYDFQEPITGALCRMKLDFETVIGEQTYLIDVKTSEDARVEAFGRSVVNYRYDVQAAFYMDGYTLATGVQPAAFVFVVIEKEPPYAVACYTVPNEVLQLGRTKYLRDLEVYQRCLETDVWNGYEASFQALELPTWAYR